MLIISFVLRLRLAKKKENNRKIERGEEDIHQINHCLYVSDSAIVAKKVITVFLSISKMAMFVYLSCQKPARDYASRCYN
jgi:hypothetical protein